MNGGPWQTDDARVSNASVYTSAVSCDAPADLIAAFTAADRTQFKITALSRHFQSFPHRKLVVQRCQCRLQNEEYGHMSNCLKSTTGEEVATPAVNQQCHEAEYLSRKLSVLLQASSYTLFKKSRNQIRCSTGQMIFHVKNLVISCTCRTNSNKSSDK